MMNDRDHDDAPAQALVVDGPARIWLVELLENGRDQARVMVSSQSFHKLLAVHGSKIFRCSVLERSDSFEDALTVRRITQVWHFRGAPRGHLLCEEDCTDSAEDRRTVGSLAADLIWVRPSQTEKAALKNPVRKPSTSENDHGDERLKVPKSWPQLVKKYPYMFPLDADMTFDFYSGWFPSFVRTCAVIDKILGRNTRDFHWVYATEKLGGARYCYSLDGEVVLIPDVHRLHSSFFENRGPADLAAQKIYAAVRTTIEASEKTCMVCGRTAALSGLKGATLSLCSEHRGDDLLADVWELSRINMGSDCF